MNNEQTYIHFAQILVHAYFNDHDVLKVLSNTCKDITWVGIENDDNCLRYQEFVAMLERDNPLLAHYSLYDDRYEVVSITPEIHQVYCAIHLKKVSSDASLSDIMIHLTMVIKYIENKNYLFSLHISKGNPSFNKKDNKLRFLHDATNIQLQEIIQQKASELEATNKDLKRLTENLPGGIFRCLNDEKLTLLHMSNGFLSMIGYTKEEVETLLNNSFRNIIDPRDALEVDKEVTRQMSISDTKSIEYRILHKDGHSIWVMDKGQLIVEEDGTSSYYCILIDTTERKETQEKLKISLERHKIITDQTNDIIFEWDIQQDSFNFSLNWKKKFGYDPMDTLKSAEIPTKSHLYKEDAIAFYHMLLEVKKGTPYLEKEVRIQKEDGSYIWCNARITTQFDDNGKPISAVGVFIDIDDVKKASEKLIEKAQRDPLTKLYNKATVQNLIEKALIPNQKHALMIIDIDNFKNINDSMGHLFGDAFLCEVSKHIQENIEDKDIVGRIGGDEFIVFINDITSIEDIQMRANKIIQVFHNIEIKEVEQQHISSSIGIAVYPTHGNDFLTLYKNADLTLYEAKKEGKNKYLICNEEILNDANFSLSPSSYSAINEKIDSNLDDSNTFSLNTLTEYVFKILYQSLNIEAAINSIIEIIGKKFDVSRVYIFENTEDDTYYTNTFEWCNKGVTSEKDKLQHVSYQQLGDNYTTNFNESDIFYCRDIRELSKEQYQVLEPQGIKSLLQCAIRDGNKIRGFVGFDECRENRFWTQTQINSLSFIAALLSTFLLKERAQRSLQESALGLQTILDNQSSWIYVIDKEDYTMHYINQKTANFVPTAKTGMYCYKAFFNRDKPCDVCPVKAFEKENKSTILEIYNPVLQVWSASNVGEINWNGKPAYLVTSYDITSYKK